MMKTRRFCTKCNTELKEMIIDELPRIVCDFCSCIESGYVEEEKGLVIDLQQFFKGEEWRIMYVMGIFRAHLERQKAIPGAIFLPTAVEIPKTLCINCKFHRHIIGNSSAPQAWYNHFCGAMPLPEVIDPVTGRTVDQTDVPYRNCRDVNKGNCSLYFPYLDTTSENGEYSDNPNENEGDK